MRFGLLAACAVPDLVDGMNPFLRLQAAEDDIALLDSRGVFDALERLAGSAKPDVHPIRRP